ncbi:MAG TPA: GAF domain-containing protein, partial [Roseiflexaceae bacterium]|nr:GAF domain-containing protein [Roseiflexaceae bacterium]
IAIYRQELKPFTDKQIELLQNFAAQAVIAIENARLLNELRQRTDDLSEALEQQTATSEVLRSISSSPGSLEPVFQSMLENAIRLCEAKFGLLYRCEGGRYRLAAAHNTPQELIDYQRNRGLFEPIAGTSLDRLVTARKTIHAADDTKEEVPSPSARIGGARSHVTVPMLKDDVLVGAIVIYRQEVRPFNNRQIELVENFAAQAVIAIENTRLLHELRQRTDELSQRTNDLTEALDRQTATADVLKIISSSPGEPQPVFESILQHATDICAAKFGVMRLREGSGFKAVAMHNAPEAYRRERQRNPMAYAGPSTGLGQMVATKRVVHIADATAENNE